MRPQSLRRLSVWGTAAGILHLLFVAPSLGEETAPAALRSEADLKRWVRELDDESYPVREAATKNLSTAGPAAVEPLSQAVLSDSAEVVWRANTALLRIAAEGDEATLDRISTALSKLSSSRPALAKLVKEVKVQQQKYRHTRAITKIRGLGGNLSGHWRDADLAIAVGGVDEGGVAVAALVDVAAAPAFAIEDAPEPAPEAAPAPRGVLGLLARLIAPDLRPAPVDITDGSVDLVPPAPAAEPEIIRRAREAVGEIRDADPLEAAETAIPSFEIPELTDPPAFLPRVDPRDLVAKAGPALEPLAEAEPVPVAPMAVEIVEVEAGDAVEAIAIDIGFAGPGAIIIDEDFGGEEGDDYAELSLDKSFRGSDADLALLKDLPELYNLKINGAKLTDKALEHVAALPKLTTLELAGTEMSSAALHKLRKQRPELSIICRSSAMLGINAGLEGSCVLTSVFYRSGAYDAGLKDGDEIVEVDGQKVRDFSDLTIAVYPHKAGDKLAVKFVRAGKEQQATVVLKPRVAVETTE
jgi:hypothetical protein